MDRTLIEVIVTRLICVMILTTSKGRMRETQFCVFAYVRSYHLTSSNQVRRGNLRGEGRVCKRSGTSPSQGAGPKRSPIWGFPYYLCPHTPSDAERPNSTGEGRVFRGSATALLSA